MTTRSLADQQERDRIEQRLDETLFVEAGAGTGKTHELVQRIANLIASGEVQANEIAAITFTVRAAAELYDRVLEELDRRREQETDPQRQQFFSDAAVQLDQTAIETLHSFAGRILRQHLIQAGLPPGFEVMDDSQDHLAFSERWQRALDDILESEALAEPLLALFDAGVELSHLEAVARQLHEDWDRTASSSAVLEEIDYDPDPFINALERVVIAASDCADPSDKMYLKLQELRPYLEELKQHRAEPGALMRLLALDKPSFKASRSGRKSNWDVTLLEHLRETITRLDSDRNVLRTQIVQSSLAPVFNALRQFVLDYADERRRYGMLSFQDLLVRASQLVSQDESVALSLHQRFKRLLIDEFQDNDPLQTQIIDGITQGKPGRAFFVGDPKQSIYRFRRADIQQFNSVKHAQSQGLTRLSQNFRSTPGVTDFVNAIFAPMMKDGGADQAEWDSLQPHRDPLDDQTFAVTVIGDDYPGQIGPIRNREADALSRLIADITHSGWEIFDKELDRQRPARFADTAVLVPTRTGLRHLLPALERRNIPYRLESRSLVYGSREVRDLLNLLRAIDDPTDQVSLVAALHSSAFACADDDLYQWRAAGGRWDYREPRPDQIDADHPVADSMRWLRSVGERRWERSVSALVGLIIRERRLLELSVLDRQPREHWARYRFLHDQARAFCDAGGSTLSEFLAWAQFQAEADTRVIESIVPEADHDAVRIMTIHAAKGLEFPIVVFAGLNSPPRDTPPPLLWMEDGRVEVQLRSGLATPGFEASWEREQEMQVQEYVRRNYVGATRARDHLIVSLYRKATKAEGRTDAAKIDAVLSGLSDPPCRRLALEELPSPPLPAAPPLPEPPLPAADEIQRRQEWFDERAAAVQRFAALPHESATSINRRQMSTAEPPDQPNLEPDDSLPPWRRGRAGTSIGRAVHSVLQVINIEQPDDDQIRDASRAQAASEALSGRAATAVERLVRRAVASDIVREAVAAPRYWREIYASADIDGVLLDGFIDLLFETPDGRLVVVDYKTDALQAGSAVDDAVVRYRDQAAAYALILEQSLNRRVDRAVLYFLEPDAAVPVPDLANRIEVVRQRLAERAELPVWPVSR